MEEVRPSPTRQVGRSSTPVVLVNEQPIMSIEMHFSMQLKHTYYRTILAQAQKAGGMKVDFFSIFVLQTTKVQQLSLSDFSLSTRFIQPNPEKSNDEAKKVRTVKAGMSRAIASILAPVGVCFVPYSLETSLFL